MVGPNSLGDLPVCMISSMLLAQPVTCARTHYSSCLRLRVCGAEFQLGRGILLWYCILLLVFIFGFMFRGSCFFLGAGSGSGCRCDCLCFVAFSERGL